MFGKFWSKCKNAVRNGAVAVMGLFVAVPAMAVIDVTDATTSITEAVTGGVLVLGALVVAFGTFLGYHIIKSLIKRG